MTLNRVILIGRPVKDLEIKTASNGKSMLRFTLAVSETKEKTNFIDIVVFDKTAEYLYNYLKPKGRLNIVGFLRNNNYEKNGIKNYGYVVVANEVSIIDFKDKDNLQQNNSFNDFELDYNIGF